jgi:two-component system sensor histidine kinase KdpD
MSKRHIRPAASKILAFLLPVFAIAIITSLLFFLRGSLNTSTIALIYLLPVLISTTIWGLGSGIFSGLLAFLSYNYFFLSPYYTFVVHRTQDLTALLIFLVVAILISQLVGQARANLAEAVARERETNTLYELSLSLAGVNALEEIGAVIASKTAETFATERVELLVKTPYDAATQTLMIPADSPSPANPADVAIPLETVRHSLGETRLWLGGRALDISAERVLRSFAAQGALALERAALASMENRAQVLEESDRLKSALLSSVSHELRTPLATIKASITSLMSARVAWDSEARMELLEAVDEETDHLNYLVGNLLDMSRIEAGALKPNRQWNLLNEIVDSVLVRIRRDLRDHQVVVDIPDEFPLLAVDYIQMEQVFTNLLTNSAKYAPEGSEIRISAKLLSSDTMEVQVSNQGPGVAPEHLDRIFSKFYRVTDADKVSGTGLGLSICKGIIEAHGGRIWAENLPEGLAFKFNLPLTWDGAPPPIVEADLL